jgi:hypothetical protein
MSNLPVVISHKCAKIFSYANFVDSANKSITDKQDEKNKIIIHTACGIYMGTLKSEYENDLKKSLTDKDYPSTIKCIYTNILEDAYSKVTQKVPYDNGTTITLEDVVLKSTSSNVTLKMSFVDIFVDQIIAVSMGSLDS